MITTLILATVLSASPETYRPTDTICEAAMASVMQAEKDIAAIQCKLADANLDPNLAKLAIDLINASVERREAALKLCGKEPVYHPPFEEDVVDGLDRAAETEDLDGAAAVLDIARQIDTFLEAIVP